MDITITFPGGKKVDAHYGDVVIRTDQSVKSGGDGSAPEPYMYFLASIGTCAGIYVLSFCQSHDIPTDGVKIIQHHEFTSPAPGKSRLSKISLDLVVPSDFPQHYYDAIIRVSEQCAVKKAIMDPPEFEIKTIVE
jgi:putative redox protein